VLLTNRGSNEGWTVVVAVCVLAPVVVGLTMRYLDRRRRQ
jgi:hypothetical protein